MQRFLRYSFLFLFFLPMKLFAQFESVQDSVVQLYGVVMTADSLQGLPSVSVVVTGTNRGTMTNEQGVFSIVVLKGDIIEFTSVGFKPKQVQIPTKLESNQYSIVQLMVTDTAYLPATIIRPRPSRAQFERDFVNTRIPDDKYEIARQNTDEAKRRVLMSTLPSDGREATNFQFRQNANRYYYAGQAPPMNVLNPFAWSEFIKAWKRGDFKSKK
ncbi:carboxypeptidase-like regulatory domain-containing protein [Segetibacter sp. 3557_3]|uniref:carboxypeptidase-like regulatory domain-containing protein n=1 Tax=Segetibacter sp. 3557_3 TaxID=2547429 RepID=UPI0010588833|nr:carboxypeptidase-like regulatory domain-containing protein [Segetibacter sp. 3557_3]TDH27744.1 carboxypeptidase-like regulatory domain-containing protein [Segetibacter sp. 3557_3]